MMRTKVILNTPLFFQSKLAYVVGWFRPTHFCRFFGLFHDKGCWSRFMWKWSTQASIVRIHLGTFFAFRTRPLNHVAENLRRPRSSRREGKKGIFMFAERRPLTFFSQGLNHQKIQNSTSTWLFYAGDWGTGEGQKSNPLSMRQPSKDHTLHIFHINHPF